MTEELVEKELEISEVHIKASDVTLQCQAVEGGVLQSLLAEIAALEGMDMSDPQSMLSLLGEEQAKAIQASEKLFKFCTGWGVVNEPPKAPSEVMKLMGVREDEPYMKRAAWIRYDLGATQKELGEVVGIVMALTFNQPPTNGQED